MTEKQKALTGFFSVFLVTGLSYWVIPYSDISMTGSDKPLLWIVEIFILSWVITFTGRIPVSMASLYAGFGFPAAVLVRIIIEIAKDPSTHNLWPFELLITTVVSLPVAFTGAATGKWIRKKWSDQQEK